jgi:lysophospholipase L1-like esterase
MTQVLEHFASTDVLLITPGTVVPGRVENHLTDESMVQYGQRLYRVADTVNSQRQARGESGKIAVVNMNAAFLSAAEKVEGGIASLLVDDGLHINQAGYEVSTIFHTSDGWE